MNNFKFTTVSTIINEPGGVSNISSIISPLGYRKILVVADNGITKAGHLGKLLQGLERSGIEYVTYADVGQDPKESMVLDAVVLATNNNVDCVVGLGGGSVLDVAKVTAVMSKTKCVLGDIYGIGQIKGGRLPLILIPTTAGTGSEVTCSAVISNQSGKKNVAIDPTLYADIALLDVEMLGTMPQNIISTTGIDAIVHAIEAYTSATKKNPISDMLACEALRYLIGNIEASFMEDATVENRAQMLLGSTLAGQAFINASVSAVHAFAYALAEKYHLPHGLSNSLVLIHILKFNIANSADLYGRLAKSIFPEAEDKTAIEAANYLVERLESILEAVELNKGLHEFNIKQEDLKELAKLATGQVRLLNNNPCAIDYADALQIFESAF